MDAANFNPTEPQTLNLALNLSLSQHEVWLDQRAWPDSAHLNIGGGAYLEGELDLRRFEVALHILVAQNDALRLAPLADGSQVLLAQYEPELEIVDLSATANPRQAMRAWWQHRIRRPFVLQGRPPWRFTLLVGGAALHGLTIQFHHLVMDGWGTTLVMKRWSEIYNALAAGQTPTAPAEPGYVQYVQESNSYRAGEAIERDASFWQTQIGQMPPPLQVRRYASARPRQLPHSQLVVQKISRSAYASLEAQGEPGGSAFNYFLAALVSYFARVNNFQEVVIGVPSLNRSGRRYRETLGMFVSVLAVRVQVNSEMTVADLLKATHAAMRSALRHSRFPLSELGRSLQLIRSGRDSIFDVMLSFERQDYAVSFGAAKLRESRQLFSGIARYALGVTVCEFHPEQDMELVLDASSACFAEGESALLGRRLWHVVESLVALPLSRLQALPIVPVEEHWAILQGLHKDVVWHDELRPFIALFEHQAVLRPEATALVWDEGSLDYATLDRRASKLAQRLALMGAGRDKLVALAIARSPDMVLALLAIAKAGAAFLPLDPDAPLERMSDILRESGALALLMQSDSWERLKAVHERTAIVDWQELDGDISTAPTGLVQIAPARPGDLAYVLFTSGSSGRPKGVMIEHGTLSKRLAWLSRAYAVNGHDRSAQATQLTFDPSLIELLLPLIHGGSVALPPPGRLLPESLAGFAVRHRVTIMAFVPSTLSRFLDAAAKTTGLKLRVACCGGEVLAPDLASRFISETGAHLYNVYGPTETAIFSTAWKCGTHLKDHALPIGRPIDNTRIYVLDAQLRPMPLGTAGEIYIGGEAIARGYLRRPDLDAEVFLDDPFCPGERMYRSGDRGWLGLDGNLHFIGRLDRQIKLRGYRIELGEIETACLSVQGVRQAAARLVQQNTKPQIHVWVAAAPSLTAPALRRVLSARLPDYMLPSGITVLDVLAESSGGKIDYDALPEPGVAPLPAVARLPATALERELLAIWTAVLSSPERPAPVGVQDNFFDLGGDSLAAVNILTDIEARLGRPVPMYVLTEHPTIERLAQALGRGIKGPDLLMHLGEGRERLPLYLAASGHGDLLRFQNLAQALGQVCDVKMLQPPLDRVVSSVAELADLYTHYIADQGHEPGLLAGFSVGGVAALETAKLLKERGVVVRGLILIDSIYPTAVFSGATSLRILAWLVRNLHIQELSMNGRRLGTMFNDPGLVSQVMALKHYRPSSFDGPTLLIKSSGLVSWDRWLFKPWRRLFGERLKETQVHGLHGSIFEADNVAELAQVLSAQVEACRVIRH